MKPYQRRRSRGFTLPELLVVIVMVGILGSISIVSWGHFTANQAVKQGNEAVFLAIRSAQNQARTTKVRCQASFRSEENQALWAVHPVSLHPDEAQWNALPSPVRYDEDNSTLRRVQGVRRVVFDHRGHVMGQLGRITVFHRDNPELRRCTFVSTLLGTIRKTRDDRCKR
ncbi:MAG: type II secretion system GspH family protein [Phormidium sp. PBR-2020]|nr:MAG: type II secretion system GspH family protein [Phormidium sp. PBR-2020]